jgi:hypothetical protein
MLLIRLIRVVAFDVGGASFGTVGEAAELEIDDKEGEDAELGELGEVEEVGDEEEVREVGELGEGIEMVLNE